MSVEFRRLILIAMADPKALSIEMDVMMDGQKVVPGFRYFGVATSDTEKWVAPFVIYPNGEIDFGTGWAVSKGSLNLHGALMDQMTDLNYNHDGARHSITFVSAADVLSKGAKPQVSAAQAGKVI